jgi:hypothetical protein
MGEDRGGRGALSQESRGSPPVHGWDDQAVADLRSAIYRRDGEGVVRALRRRPPEDVLQVAGDGLLAALAMGIEEARELAERCVTLLRERWNSGDEELADEFEAALGRRPSPMLRPLPIDLEELSSMLEGDPTLGGGRIDVQTGETWPSGTEDLWREKHGSEEDLDEESDRWLWVECLGSRDGYQDMEDFIATVANPQRGEMLEVAISGRGAFRRFKDVLARWPGALDRWHLFSGERSRGRARAWLAEEGFRPAVRGHR